MLRTIAVDGAAARRCRRLSRWLLQAGKALRNAGRLMCGIPDYDHYVAHLRLHHPDWPVPSYQEFFQQRQDARYGRNGNARCC